MIAVWFMSFSLDAFISTSFLEDVHGTKSDELELRRTCACLSSGGVLTTTLMTHIHEQFHGPG